MHIVLAVLGALAAALWAFVHFMNAAREGREAIGDVKGVIRRGKWNRRVEQRLIENLSARREAAAILIYQVAAYDGAVTDCQRDKIIADMRETFEADQETADGLFAFARMAVGQIDDAGQADGAIDIFEALPIERFTHALLRARIWSLRENLTAYDAAYFALAELLQASLWRRDENFCPCQDMKRASKSFEWQCNDPPPRYRTC